MGLTLSNVLKTYGQGENIGLDQDVLKTYDRSEFDQDVLKTSSEDKDGRHLQEVFIKTTVCWEAI